MEVPSNKKVVCITGSVWTGSRSAPRRMLVSNGFLRPVWFTTQRRIHDASYEQMSETDFHLHNADKKILAYIEHGSDFVGVLKQALESAMRDSEKGVLVVGPQEIAAQIASALPRTVVFTLKEKGMTLSPKLGEVKQRGQLHRVDVDVLQPGAWSEVYAFMCDKLRIETKSNPF
ncbi:MAG: hypothetical protein GY792_01150 [Gammaproteobacteria bacterium]|nr:hypothetical protein [Gammaproteobacteria bacterium]